MCNIKYNIYLIKLNYISMFFLPFVPLIATFVGICIATADPQCNEFACGDLIQDSLDCDVCWCYEEGGFGCFCCTMCRN